MLDRVVMDYILARAKYGSSEISHIRMTRDMVAELNDRAILEGKALPEDKEFIFEGTRVIIIADNPGVVFKWNLSIIRDKSLNATQIEWNYYQCQNDWRVIVVKPKACDKFVAGKQQIIQVPGVRAILSASDKDDITPAEPIDIPMRTIYHPSHKSLCGGFCAKDIATRTAYLWEE